MMREEEKQQLRVGLYAKLSEAEVDIANGDEGENFPEVARELRNGVRGKPKIHTCK